MNNIAIFVKNLGSGGAEKQSVLLAKNLAKEKQLHYIIFDGSIVHQKYLEMLKEEKKITITIFYGNVYKRFRNFLEYLNKQNIQAIFSYLTAANFYACIAAKILNIKVYPGLRNARLPFLKLITDKFLCNYYAEKMISNSFSGKEHFISKGFKEKYITVIPNCFENIRPYKEKEKTEQVIIITVGRFVPQKDYETAIQSISYLKKECSNIIFNIVGYGKQEAHIRKWIKKYQIEDITRIYINPNNIDELLNQAHIYLSTSIFEGTSNSIMEGMNADLPIVATNVGDNSQLIISGKNGFLCNIKDTIDIAKQLKRLVISEEERKQMGKASKEILEKNFSTATFLKSYLKLLKAVQE